MVVFPVPGGPDSRTPRLGFRPNFGGQFAILEGKRDLGFQRVNEVVHPLQIVPRDGLHFFDFDVADQVALVQIIEK